MLSAGEAVVAAPVGDNADHLGLFAADPGALSPAQVAQVLASRDAQAAERARAARGGDHGRLAPVRASAADDPDAIAPWKRARELRAAINRRVQARSRSTGIPHGSLHAEVVRAVPGPATVEADVALLDKRHRWICRSWF